MQADLRFEIAVKVLSCCAAVTHLMVSIHSVNANEREVMDSITTSRLIPGAPYELAGKRIVFTNWYYVQPGDLDWRNEANESVYVHGNEGSFAAHHVAIHAPHGIRLLAEKPEIRGPSDRPYRMIMRDDGKYKAWTESDYYESDDAMRWEHKSRLEFDAAKDGSIYQVFVDPSSSEERFKAVWTADITPEQFKKYREQFPNGWEPRAMLHYGDHNTVSCLRGSVSSDGIRWRSFADPLVVEYSDSWNTAYYDTTLRQIVIYTRYWSIGPTTARLPADIRRGWTGVGRRAIGRTASSDFRHFQPSEMILEPTPDMLPSEQLYTNCYTTVPGAPDQHLMFPTIWNASIDDTTRIAFASSHNGINWHWVPGGNLMQTQAFGSWNGGCIWATPNLIELPGGDWALPYLAHIFPHKYPRGQNVGGTGYAVWPKGRLVSVHAEDRGEFTIIPLICPGNKLKINAVTARSGWIKVEVQGSENRTIENCVPIIGDQHWATVTWKDGDEIGAKPGAPVTLHVVMQQAKLYGFEFE